MAILVIVDYTLFSDAKMEGLKQSGNTRNRVFVLPVLWYIEVKFSDSGRIWITKSNYLAGQPK